MFSLLMFGKKMQGYKVTDNKRSRKFGIAANSLKMLTEKAAVKFNIKDCCLYLAKDGSKVTDEEYFSTIEPQTLFVAVPAGETKIVTEFDVTMNYIRDNIGSGNLNHEQILNTLLAEYPEKLSKAIANYQKSIFQGRSKTDASHKSEHEDWFQGQDSNFNTKEEAMAKRAQDRIRGYYYKTKDEITKCALYKENEKARKIFDHILEVFRYLLIGCNYFSMIFDRKCKRKHAYLHDQTDMAGNLPSKKLRQMIKEYTSRTEMLEDWSVSLCNDRGDFYCQGLFNSSSGICDKGHMINPYVCRENLLVFQVWNLDHQIELTRTVLPSLLDNVRSLVEEPNQKCPLHGKKVKDVNIIEYFLELFSVKNLKLVYIVCHDKAQRSNTSNGRLVCEKCSEYMLIKDFTEGIQC